jgi:hypothetical protein
MAAGEDQAQAVVGHLSLSHGLGRQLRLGGLGLARLEALEALEHLLLLLSEPLAPQPVDRLVAGDARDPGAGVVGDAVGRPPLERDDEGLLDRLLGGVDVTEDADQARDRPSRLVPEQAVDELFGALYEDAFEAGVAPASAASS